MDDSTYRLDDDTVVSTTNRFCPDVPPIARNIPSDRELFGSDQKPNLQFLRDHFIAEGKLSESQVLAIIAAGTTLLRAEPNLLVLPAPITICGDIHGQYYDLMKLFEVSGGEPPLGKFLFLGDYVDRGYFSLECYLYLLAIKINYPTELYLLRGNHECRHLTKHFTFKLECTYKYSGSIYDATMDSFDSLPIAAVVNSQFFCVHGGISPELRAPKDVNSFDRIKELPKQGLMCDLLWSDPSEDYGIESGSESFVANGARGCSYRYTYKGVCEFLSRNKLLSVVRGHEAQDVGYRLYRQAAKSEFPTVITLFSAPNYVDVYNNKAAVMKYDGKTMNIRQFNCSPHPYYLPKFMNVFDWSLPFVGEKIAELLIAVLNVNNLAETLEDLTPEERARLEQQKQLRADVIKSKIRLVGKLNKMYSTIRDERETLAELMNVMGTKIIPTKYLTLGHEELRKAIKTFEDAKRCDSINETLPPTADDSSETASVVSLTLGDTREDEAAFAGPLKTADDRVSARSPSPQLQRDRS